MPKTIIQSDRAWRSRLPFAQATLAGGIFQCCSVGYDQRGMLVGPGDIRAQTRQTLENVAILLAEAGGELRDVTKCTVYLTDRANYDGMNEVFFSIFAEQAPLRATILCQLAFPELLVEVDATAWLGSESAGFA